jgi:peptide/nickel transport system substrate-binding protein
VPVRRRLSHAVGLLLALPLLLTACSAPSTSPAAAGTPLTLRVGTPFLSQPDPVRGGFNAVQFGLAETLLRLSEDLQPQPWLATAVEPRSATTWVVTLRPDVTFHDGSAMDAAAVKASLERALELSAAARALLGVTGIQVQAPDTLLMKTAAPTPHFPGLLTHPATAIVSTAAAERLGDEFPERPVTTSMFQVERYALDRELVATRYDGYWGGPARTPRLEVTVLADAGARLLGLQSGQLDVAFDLAPENVRQVAADDTLRVVPAPPVATIFAYLDHSRPPLDDPRVRQAVAHATPDRGVLVDAVLRGQGSPATGVFPPAVLDCQLEQPYRHDPELARRLLASAGYRDVDGDGLRERDGRPLEISLLSYPQRAALSPAAEILQAHLREVGIAVSIRVVEQIDQALAGDGWDAAMYFNNLASTGDPYGSLSQFFRAGGEANAGSYRNPDVDEAIDRLRSTSGREQRRALACQVQDTLTADVAVLPLAHPSHVYGVGAGVSGFASAHPYFLYFVTGELARH